MLEHPSFFWVRRLQRILQEFLHEVGGGRLVTALATAMSTAALRVRSLARLARSRRAAPAPPFFAHALRVIIERLLGVRRGQGEREEGANEDAEEQADAKEGCGRFGHANRIPLGSCFATGGCTIGTVP